MLLQYQPASTRLLLVKWEGDFSHASFSRATHSMRRALCNCSSNSESVESLVRSTFEAIYLSSNLQNPSSSFIAPLSETSGGRRSVLLFVETFRGRTASWTWTQDHSLTSRLKHKPSNSSA
ncbi:hypothetical protein Mp_1g15880 [Marchantia polymorpha subsp. ruderalis]|uniref:Uncharacterized protein n=2 Tax=Marchantia polymorpha TaxID=3197 RepID=A0AAF6AQM3_MARPO|nr:hypothetical protein MARPO_0033s0072 [Marchantia polymorpha]BBM98743.1 hypothetical protein Mp_1g15880 [Marchantia polymorpha subsp. ruderalis]|eukprot:PTQ41662.1 hypothetical protein MARPO_0033s0072 [Marchantia polymorpha]